MIKILAIDDKRDNLISLGAIIEDAFADSQLFTSLTGAEGIELAIAEDPDVILLDLVMPRMDGFEVCEKLKLNDEVSDIPVVFLTAIRGDRESRIKALDIGAEAFLAKPIDETELIAQIKAMVKIKAANRHVKNEKERLEKLVYERTKELESSRNKTLLLLKNLEAENELRIKTEDDLEETETHFRTLANSGHALIWTSGVDKIFNYFNQPWLDFTGRVSEQEYNEGWKEGVYPEDFERFMIVYEQAFDKRENFVSEFRIKDFSGSYRWVLNNSKPRFNSKQEFIGYIGHCLDITAMKKVESELISAKEKAEESDRLKSAFLHNISHEIRTPMNAIIGFSDFLSNPELTFDKRIQYSGIIIRSSHQLLSIITDIVNIATIESGQDKVCESSVNINSICQLLYDQFLHQAKSKQLMLTFETELTDSDSEIVTDMTKFTQILTNLIGNALKFTQNGYIKYGYIHINDTLQFYVEDSGIGIAAHLHKSIFDRFNQVDTTLTRTLSGSGLGLAISKAYIEMMGGRIWVNSDLGHGSTFNFTLPYKQDFLHTSEAIKHPNTELENNTKQKTILIAENEDLNYGILEEILASENVHLIRAVNGFDTIDICRNNPNIDLLVLEIEMPDIDGFELIHKIKEMYPELPVIAQDSHNNTINSEKVKEYGFADIIEKPINKSLILSKISRQLD